MICILIRVCVYVCVQLCLEVLPQRENERGGVESASERGGANHTLVPTQFGLVQCFLEFITILQLHNHVLILWFFHNLPQKTKTKGTSYKRTSPPPLSCPNSGSTMISIPNLISLRGKLLNELQNNCPVRSETRLQFDNQFTKREREREMGGGD